MSVTLHVRKMVRDDLDEVLELTSQLGFPTNKPDLDTRFGVLDADANAALFVAVCDTKVIGYVHAGSIVYLDEPPLGEIVALVVLENFRGQGAGKKLVEACEAWFLQRGFASSGLYSQTFRADAHAFYEKLGYHRTMTSHFYKKTLSTFIAILFVLIGTLLGTDSLAYDARDVVVWHDLESFVSAGQCAAAPLSAGLVRCSPARLGLVKDFGFRANGFVSASELVLDAADTLRKKTVDPQKINNLLKNYDSAEFLLLARMDVTSRYGAIGVFPKRYTGQFFLHNPNLPFASVVFRDDTEGYVGYGKLFSFGELHLLAGAKLSALQRTETIGEASIAEIAAKPFKELSSKRKRFGTFADLSTLVSASDMVTLALDLRDLGAWHKGEEIAQDTLFIEADRVPRLQVSAAYLPRFLFGTWQIGGSLINKLDPVEPNEFSKQWFGTVNYFNSALGVLSSFNNKMLRTGLSLRYDKYQTMVAHQWYDIRDASEHRPRLLTVEMGAEL